MGRYRMGAWLNCSSVMAMTTTREVWQVELDSYRLRSALDLPMVRAWEPEPVAFPIPGPRLRMTVAWWSTCRGEQLPRSSKSSTAAGESYRAVVTYWRDVSVEVRFRYVADDPRTLWEQMLTAGHIPEHLSHDETAMHAWQMTTRLELRKV